MADNATSSEIVGWVGSDNTRGSIDILWSCCITIILCCWVSTRPNVPALNDKWYHRIVDKANLAHVGLLGPDFLFAIAAGQLSSARRAVKLFKSDPELLGEREWTLTHGFFADMGGFLLTSPDYEMGFPIDAEQLYYLIKHGHLDFPSLTLKEIKDRNSADTVSKLITLWQVTWFAVTELHRARLGLPMTTLELTAISFSLTMIGTSACWHCKPTISRPIIVRTKDDRTVEDIRRQARNTTHPELPTKWYRTPLDFISRCHFNAQTHWAHLTDISHYLKLPLFSRPMKSALWDRIPGDEWKPCDPLFLPPATVVLLGVAASFVVAWNFHFPTRTEQLIWHVGSVCHFALSTFGGIYYLAGDFSAQREIKKNMIKLRQPQGQPQNDSQVRKPSDMESAHPASQHCNIDGDRLSRRFRAIIQWARIRWRNISPEQDPSMEVRMRIGIPVLIGCFLYSVLRISFYVEVFMALRSQPKGVYITVNRFVPFL